MDIENKTEGDFRNNSWNFKQYNWMDGHTVPQDMGHRENKI